MKNVYLFNDSLGQNNWGCRATTMALVGLIEQAGGKVVGRHKLERLTTVGESPVSALSKAALNGMPPLRRAVRSARWKVEELRGTKTGRAWKLADFDELARRITRGEVWHGDLDNLKEADVVIVNGEGAVYAREQKGILTLFFCYFVKKYLGKPCALVNHTADFSDPVMQEIGEQVYPMLDDVVFREGVSHRNWAQLAPQVPNSYAPDAAFSLSPLQGHEWFRSASRPGSYSIWPDRADQFDGRRPYICLTGSSSLMRPDGRLGSPQRAFAALIDSLSKLEHQIVLVGADATDEIFLRPLASKYNLAFVPASTPTPQGLDLLANAACLVGGRWHPSILAATGGTPSVGFSANTYKIRGVLEILGLDTTVYDCSTLESQADRIAQHTKNYLDAGEELRRQIRGAAKRAADATPRHVSILNGGAADA